jgi:hypothetical protein
MRCPAEKKGRAPFDLNRTAVYRFGQPDPGQATGLGPAWLSPAASARFSFFQKISLMFL